MPAGINGTCASSVIVHGQPVDIEVICQKQLDARTLYRRVRIGTACWDEVVDLYTGEIKRKSVPCEPCNN